MSFTEYISIRVSGASEIVWLFLPMIGYAFLVGSIVGFRYARRRFDLVKGLSKTLLITVLPPAAFFFAAGVLAWRDIWPTPNELTILVGLKSGLIHMIFFGTSFLLVGGCVSFLSCCGVHLIVRQYNNSENAKVA